MANLRILLEFLAAAYANPTIILVLLSVAWGCESYGAGAGSLNVGIGSATMESCRVAAGVTDCPSGCAPVITSSRYSNRACTKDGVFLGCVPNRGSSYWPAVHTDDAGVCDRPVFDPQYYYCLEGRENVAFYNSLESFWCSEVGGCPEEVVTECDWNSNAND